MIQVEAVPWGLLIDEGQLILQMRAEIQAFRVRIGLGSMQLKWHDGVAAVAEAHSKDMELRGFFSHTNPDGLNQGDRARAALGPCYAAENIGRGSYKAPDILNAWETSTNPGHPANLRLCPPQFTHWGVGRYGWNWTLLLVGGLT